MTATITIRDESAMRQVLDRIALELPERTVTVRDLIRARVSQATTARRPTTDARWCSPRRTKQAGLLKASVMKPVIANHRAQTSAQETGQALR